MNPTRREALAAVIAGTTGLRSLHAADEPKLTVSTFAVEITVPIGHALMGGGIAPAKEVLDPLFAHGFVLRGAGKPVAFVALDWCEVRNGAYDLFRSAIAHAVRTDPVRVMVCSLHQHDAPVADLEAQDLLEKHKAGASVCDLAFLERAVSRVADAAKESLASAKPVTHVGTGQARVEKVASNRRYTDEGGAVRYNRMSATRDPKIRAAEDGTIDPFLKTVSLWNGDTPLLGLSAYATHPMSFYGKGGVTADFVGLARRRRQSDTPGVFQMYASGCSGNVTAGKYNDGAPENRPVLADRMHAAMAAVWKDTKRHSLKDVAFRPAELKLEARSSAGFTEDELTKRLIPNLVDGYPSPNWGGIAMKRLPVIDHLPPAEIARRYRTCPEGAEKTRWQVLWLVTRPDQPMAAGRAALSVGLTASWGRTLLKRWNEHGPDGLADRRKGNGADPVLTPAQQAELYAALQADPPDGGLWTGPKVARYVRDRWGVEVVPQTGWRWLVRLGFSLRVPRPRHPKAATPDEQRGWL